jgi:hypothetical protein
MDRDADAMSKSETLLSGADNMEKKGSLAWKLVPITSARP